MGPPGIHVLSHALLVACTETCARVPLVFRCSVRVPVCRLWDKVHAPDDDSLLVVEDACLLFERIDVST